MGKLSVILRRAIVGFAFLIPFVPLLVTTGLHFPFVSGKGFAFRFLILLLCALWVLLATLEPRFRPRRTPIFIAILVFVGVIGVADLFGEDPYRSLWSNFERMEGLVSLFHLAAYFLILGSVFNQKEWHLFFHTSVGVALFLTYYVFLQHANVLFIEQGGLRPDGTFGNATYLAGYLLLHVFLTLFLSVSSQPRRRGFLLSFSIGAALFALFFFWRQAIGASGVLWVLLLGVSLSLPAALYWWHRRLPSDGGPLRVLPGAFLIALFSAGIFSTGTRGATLGLLLGFLAFAIYSAWRLRGVARYVSLIALLLIIASPLVLFSLREHPLVKQQSILQRLVNISLKNEDLQARFIVWRIGLRGVLQKPMLGWGQENFKYVFEANFAPRLSGREPWFDRTHNIFLDWAIAGGIVGLVGYLSLFAAALHALFRRVSGSERMSLIALLLAYSVHNFFVFDHLGSYLLFFSLLAYLHQVYLQAATHDESVAAGKRKVTAAENESARLGILYRLTLPLTVVGFAAVVWVSILRPVHASALFIDALHVRVPEHLEESVSLFERALALGTFAQKEIREGLAQFVSELPARMAQVVEPVPAVPALFTLTMRELAAELKRVPKETRLHYLTGAVLLVYGLHGEARTHFLAARDLSKNKSIILHALALSFVGEKKFEEAIPYFKEALTLAPHLSDTRIAYGATAILTGDFATADSLFREASGFPVVFDDRVTHAYVARGETERLLGLWEDIVAAHPTNGEYAFLAGKVALSAGEVGRGETFFQHALERDVNLRGPIEEFLKSAGFDATF